MPHESRPLEFGLPTFGHRRAQMDLPEAIKPKKDIHGTKKHSFGLDSKPALSRIALGRRSPGQPKVIRSSKESSAYETRTKRTGLGSENGDISSLFPSYFKLFPSTGITCFCFEIHLFSPIQQDFMLSPTFCLA